jgi:hypothetical protein
MAVLVTMHFLTHDESIRVTETNIQLRIDDHSQLLSAFLMEGHLEIW